MQDFQIINGIVDLLEKGNVQHQYGMTAKRLLGLLENPRSVLALANKLSVWGYEQKERASWTRAKAIQTKWRALTTAPSDKDEAIKFRAKLDEIRMGLRNKLSINNP